MNEEIKFSWGINSCSYRNGMITSALFCFSTEAVCKVNSKGSYGDDWYKRQGVVISSPGGNWGFSPATDCFWIFPNGLAIQLCKRFLLVGDKLKLFFWKCCGIIFQRNLKSFPLDKVIHILTYSLSCHQACPLSTGFHVSYLINSLTALWGQRHAVGIQSNTKLDQIAGVLVQWLHDAGFSTMWPQGSGGYLCEF